MGLGYSARPSNKKKSSSQLQEEEEKSDIPDTKPTSGQNFLKRKSN